MRKRANTSEQGDEAAQPIARLLPLLPLNRTQAHIWQLCSDLPLDTALLDAYEQLLCREEQEQYRRFVFAAGRREYLLTRALVRTTLSRYVPVAPQAWRFENNAYGKPAIAFPHDTLPLSFNLAHTHGLIVCIVALDREVGIDVEDLERSGETVEIAEHFFSPQEVAALRELPQSEQRLRFFTYWTLKEAYIKARGMGLSLPLEQFSFHLAAHQPVRISFVPSLPDDPASWQFFQHRPTPRHLLAAALHCGAEPPLTVHIRQTIPLVF